MISIKERSTESIKALAYDIRKSIKYYRGVLEVVEKEIEQRAQAELETKAENKKGPE